MNKNIYACYATSEFYARETGISMIGFFENNPDYAPEVLFILDYGIHSESIELLKGIANQYGKRVVFLPAKQILEKIQKELNLKDFRGSLATYSRAFIDRIVPEYVDLLFYIDSDTVVTGSIAELNQFDMSQECMAGVYSPTYTRQILNKKLTLYSSNTHYYGCGIVLFNLNNWRSYNCYDKIIKMLSQKKDLPCADQTLINNSLEESYFKKLPLKYNYTTHIFSEKYERVLLKRAQVYTMQEIHDAIRCPVVVHYPGRSIDRPWFKSCTSRKKDDYFKYKALSPWRDDELNNNDIKFNGFRSIFSDFVHVLETNSSLYFLLEIINTCRSILGPILRYFKIFPRLPIEGVE